MHIPKFKDFLSEQTLARNSKPITVAVITKTNPNIKKRKVGGKEDKELTVDYIAKSCEKLNVKCVIIETRHAIITGKDEEKNTLTVYNFDGEDSEHTFIGKDTVCITRAGAVEDEAGLSIISAFQNSGSFMCNTRNAMLTCNNKLTSALLFEKFNIPTPKTAFISNEKNIDDALEMIGGIKKFPVIVKTLTGTQGIGVVKVDSYDGLVSTIQALWKHGAELLLQEYMPSDSDIRTFVVDNKIFASTERVQGSDDFRTNTHRGATAKPYKLSDEEIDLILRASRASKAYLCGVDHIIYKNKPYILEVNGSPGTGAEYESYSYEDPFSDAKNSGSIKGDKLTDNVIKWILERKHWDRQSLIEAGWLETMEIEGFGKIRAKLDTGNGAKACSFHAEDIKVKGKTVSWKYNGKSYTEPKHGESKVFRANAEGEEPSETRPTILLDLAFNGFVYKDVEFGLDERPRSSSDLLLNRETIRLFNASVNPNRTFCLSKRLPPVDKD
tara:strand:+ start:375 stop:1868 length:1494 start_codon:yes stop_codon:yes gene_type:complete